MLKKLGIGFLVLSSLLFGPGAYKQAIRDYRIPQSVVRLVGPQGKGSCSGVHVNINNKVYILSAAHCLVLASDGSILVEDDYSKERIARKVLLEDDMADLIVLEALPGRRGINIANSVYRTDILYTYTHGFGYKTYKTTGSYVDSEVIEVPLFEVSEENKCDTTKPKYVEKQLDFFFSSSYVCFLKENTLVTDAFIVPGSSGGAVTDKYGNLIGIVSAGNPAGFGYLVTLEDIQRFVALLK